jgi:hypothetical protein
VLLRTPQDPKRHMREGTRATYTPRRRRPRSASRSWVRTAPGARSARPCAGS